MNMNYSRWVNEVRRKLAQSGEPSPELLVARAERDLPGMYMAGETASGAAARLHRYRANPTGLGIVLGLAAALGVGWLLLRPKKAAAAPKPPVAPIDTSVPFEPFAVAQWASSRNIAMQWDDNGNIMTIGLVNSPALLMGKTGVPYFWKGYDNGMPIQDMQATYEYKAWYKATKAGA